MQKGKESAGDPPHQQRRSREVHIRGQKRDDHSTSSIESLIEGGIKLVKPSSHEVSPQAGIKPEIGEQIMTFSDLQHVSNTLQTQADNDPKNSSIGGALELSKRNYPEGKATQPLQQQPSLNANSSSIEQKVSMTSQAKRNSKTPDKKNPYNQKQIYKINPMKTQPSSHQMVYNTSINDRRQQHQASHQSAAQASQHQQPSQNLQNKINKTCRVYGQISNLRKSFDKMRPDLPIKEQAFPKVQNKDSTNADLP